MFIIKISKMQKIIIFFLILFPFISKSEDCNENLCPDLSYPLTEDDFEGMPGFDGTCWFVRSYGKIYICDINMNYLCVCNSGYTCKGCVCGVDTFMVFSPETFFGESCVPSTPRPTPTPHFKPTPSPTISLSPTSSPSISPSSEPTLSPTLQPITSSSSENENHLIIKISIASICALAFVFSFIYFFIYRKGRLLSNNSVKNPLLEIENEKEYY